MADSRELKAATAAIASTGVFFCKTCWVYKPLATAKPSKQGKICKSCVAKKAAAKKQNKG